MTQVDQGNGQQQAGFNPNNHVMQLKSKEGSKDYLPVQWRVVWFRERCPEGTIDTEEMCVDLDREVEEEVFVWNNEKRRSEKVVKRARGYARFKAVVTDGKGGRATGTKSENAASFPDFVEKAETGAIGRALAALGYGTQFAPEFNEAHRIVDSPVERATSNSDGVRGEVSHPLANASAAASASQDENSTSLVTDQQVNSVRKLCEHLGKPEPANLENMSYIAAKKLIPQLTTEYREQKDRKETPVQLQPKAVLDMIAKAKARVAALDMIWDDAKRDANLGTVADTALTVAQVAQINGVITRYEQRAS